MVLVRANETDWQRAAGVGEEWGVCSLPALSGRI
jgi:hypothetical protein